jgi:light-regulated signal transduction histidine kinase (bacteriophytochrome)
MAEGTPTSLENLFTYANGDTRWFELRIQPVSQGLCIHSVDITARRQAVEDLQRLNEGLEQEVRARTRALEDANAELEAFSYSVSHDLRAPLRHVTGFAELVRRRAGAALDTEASRHLDSVVRAAERMGRLIDDLLAFSRTGRQPLHRRMVDLGALVREARDEVAPAAEGREVEWSIGPLPEVHADPALIRLVLVNLLGNALKFSRDRRPARIAVEARHDAGEVAVSVRDNGVGFDMTYADRLFGAFQRLHSESEFPGTGIGLANVRRIVHRHGGRTWAEAAPGAGATFHFTLPAPLG